MRTKIMALFCVAILPLVYVNCVGGKFQTLDASTSASSLSNTIPTSPTSPTSPASPTGHMVSVIVGQGHMGRTLMSCDDGRTWIHDQSDSSTLICFGPAGNPNSIDCDHNISAGHGLDFGDGYFYTNFGWGFNGSLRRSKDGATWETMNTSGWGSGVAFARGTLFLDWPSSPYPDEGILSFDHGVTWHNRMPSPVADAFSGHLSVQRAGDYIALLDGALGLALSSDGAQTWIQPASFLPAWAANAQFATANNRLVIVSFTTATDGSTSTMVSAVSTDMGASWTGMTFPTITGGANLSNLLFDGTYFVFWSNSKMWKSTDGINWTSQAMVLPAIGALKYSVSPVGITAAGTYVAIPNVWANYYGAQYAYRSTDGINWTVLDSSHFIGGHPMFHFVNGMVDSSACP